jgi:hypothetical protein
MVMNQTEDDFIMEWEELYDGLEEALDGVSYDMRKDLLCVMVADTIFDHGAGLEEAMKRLNEWSDTIKESITMMQDHEDVISKFERRNKS